MTIRNILLLMVFRCHFSGNLVFARTVSTNFTSHVWRSPFLYERLTKVLSGCNELKLFVQLDSLTLFPQLYTVLGHLAAVFCVLFDHTGRCIITVSKFALEKHLRSLLGYSNNK